MSCASPLEWGPLLESQGMSLFFRFPLRKPLSGPVYHTSGKGHRPILSGNSKLIAAIVFPALFQFGIGNNRMLTEIQVHLFTHNFEQRILIAFAVSDAEGFTNNCVSCCVSQNAYALHWNIHKWYS